MNVSVTSPHPALEVRGVSHWFGDLHVLHQINFAIEAGQIAALVGPSGCGKSTLLRAILGTHLPKNGTVLTNGLPVRGPNRHVGIVYQDYSLYEFLTAVDNVAFSLMLDGTSTLFRWFRPFRWARLRKQHRREALQLLEKMGMAQAADRYPLQMSGGMQQRVAIAQALILKPQVLLLDEPFGALDAATREDLQLMLLHFYQENLEARQRGQRPPYTILMVTHELDEALYVADRVLGLSQYHGRGFPGATIVYDKPAPIFRPDDARDFDKFQQQRDELRRTVFDPTTVRHHQELVQVVEELAGMAERE